MTPPAVSIIVPVYNTAPLLARCLESLRGQTFADFECFCVDDGSTDGSDAILARCAAADPRFRVLTQSRHGCGHARNTGLQHATGRTIGFVDSDDYLHPRMLELLHERLYAENADLAVCGFRSCRTCAAPAAVNPANLSWSTTEAPLAAFLERRLPVRISVWGKLYRRELLAAHPFRPGLLFEDVPFTTCLLHDVRRVVLTHEPLYYYDESGASITRSAFSEEKMRACLAAIEIVDAFYQEMDDARLLALVRRTAVPRAIKDLLNGAVNGLETGRAQRRMYARMRPRLHDLQAAGIVRYRCLNWRHCLVLFLLLRTSPALAWAAKRAVSTRRPPFADGR
jgi:glycosyltransferase involved in cell wall biosynthesis